MGLWDKLFGRRGARPAPSPPPGDGPSLEALQEALAGWRRAHTRPAWRPVTEAGEGDAAGSRFGGLPWLPQGETLPRCGTCGRLMRLLVQLDLASLPPEAQARLGAHGLLQVLGCEDEDCGPSWEAFDASHRVRVVDPSQPGARAAAEGRPFLARCIVAWEPLPGDLPHPEEHAHQGLHVEHDFKAGTLRVRCPEVGLETPPLPDDAFEEEELGRAHDKDKLLGWPCWIQGVEYPSCPRCGREMEHVFQLDSEDHLPWMWGDSGIAHVTRCPEHPDVLTLAWACC